MMRLLIQSPGIASGVAACRVPRRPGFAEPLRLIAEYRDDAAGALALADAVRAATREWGISWVEEPAGALAYKQAGWLLSHGHPVATYLQVHVEYESERRSLVIAVGDPGEMLPTPTGGERCQTLTDVAECVIAARGCGRTLRGALMVRAAWRVRITWDTQLIEGRHPEFTFEDCESEADARGSAARAVRNKAVRSAHWQGPEDRDEHWREARHGPA